MQHTGKQSGLAMIDNWYMQDNKHSEEQPPCDRAVDREDVEERIRLLLITIAPSEPTLPSPGWQRA
jgi:hypothetical protein